MAITFRPGGHTGSFEGKRILPAGVSTMFILRYHSEQDAGDGCTWHMPLSAYHATVHASGAVEYASYGQRLRLDLALRPRAGNRGKAIGPERNPSLLETALRMDKACQRAVMLNRRVGEEIILPRVLLAFPATRLPAFADTPHLRQLAATEIRIPQVKLGNNGDVLLERLLRNVWERQLIQPGEAGNQTGAVLIDSRLCPGETSFLRAFEDFTELLGNWTWNPARQVKVECHPNPAYEVLREVGLGDRPDFNQPLEPEFVVDMLRRFKVLLGDAAVQFTDEDLLDGLTTPNQALVRWSFELPRLKQHLPVWAAEACTDEDLKAAVREAAGTSETWNKRWRKSARLSVGVPNYSGRPHTTFAGMWGDKVIFSLAGSVPSLALSSFQSIKNWRDSAQFESRLDSSLARRVELLPAAELAQDLRAIHRAILVSARNAGAASSRKCRYGRRCACHWPG